MIEVTETNHALVLNASLVKIYNQAKLKGKLNSNDLYLLNVLYRFIKECNIELTNEQLTQLSCLYRTIYNTSNNICKVRTVTGFPVNKNTKFIVAEKEDENITPTVPKVVYWQEPLGVTYQDILDLIATGTYLDTKDAATVEAFEAGFSIDYIDIGLIVFALNCSEEDDEYIIYDVLGNDVTGGFNSYFNAELNTRIFIGINIYSIGILTTKIIKT